MRCLASHPFHSSGISPEDILLWHLERTGVSSPRPLLYFKHSRYFAQDDARSRLEVGMRVWAGMEGSGPAPPAPTNLRVPVGGTAAGGAQPGTFR